MGREGREAPFSLTSGTTSQALRRRFLGYFEGRGHLILPSASLLPRADDASLLFTNAGMVPFKDYFLGTAAPPSTRVATVQRCLRAGGKHNDLENVGHTARHHTFFEMLGNFSFGAYSKREAIELAWAFLTKELGLPRDRLHISVLEGDEETANIWTQDRGVPRANIMWRGVQDNFWSMGDGPGPCGRCSEIYWDQLKPVDGERYLELWNLVFMDLKRTTTGEIVPLETPCIDTGMGLERLAAVMQGKQNNYEIDTISRLISEASAVLRPRPAVTRDSVALKVIVDHLRASCFLISDGIVPSSVGRGYLLRRLLRRAVRFARTLTAGNNDGTSKEKYKPGAMGEIATAVIDEMQDAYPELDERRGVILELISREEAAFLQTLDQGLAILERSMRETEGPTMPPQIAVHLYTRLGFPLDLTAAIVQEHDKQLDLQAVEALLAEEKEKSKMHAFNFSREGSPRAPIRSRMSGGAASAFSGYEKVMEESAKVLGVESDENGLWLRIDPCPFYGLGGGQVGDRGYLEIDHGTQPFRLDISDTIAAPNSEGGLLFSPRKNLPQERIPSWLPEAVGSHVRAVVDSRHRDAVRVHHTATHLLHSALRRVLGANVVQAGSVVEADKLRFDFTYPEPLGDDQLRQIESLVRDCIAQDVRVQTQTLDLEDARRSGALSLFSEKYPSKVRVVQVPGVSNELCAGTHAERTGVLRPFKITHQASVALGTRRIEAVAGLAADIWYEKQWMLLQSIGEELEVAPTKILERLQRFIKREKQLEGELDRLRRRLAILKRATLAPTYTNTFKGVPLQLYIEEQEEDEELLLRIGEALAQDTPQAVHLLLVGGKLLCVVGRERRDCVSAKAIMRETAHLAGGRGGGHHGIAQGHVKDHATAAKALEQWLSRS